jgi:hypothetical protein
MNPLGICAHHLTTVQGLYDYRTSSDMEAHTSDTRMGEIGGIAEQYMRVLDVEATTVHRTIIDWDASLTEYISS